MRERRHGQMKNEIMNGNQGDHVTFVWSWRRCKQRLSFVAHFIHLFNTTMPMSCTDVHSGAPMSHFLHRRVGMGHRPLSRQVTDQIVLRAKLHSRHLVYTRRWVYENIVLKSGALWLGESGACSMGCQVLNFLSRGNYVFKLSRMHACLQNVQPLYKTFNAPALWKTSQVWVSSAARQERPSMFSISQK